MRPRSDRDAIDDTEVRGKLRFSNGHATSRDDGLRPRVG